MDPISSVDTLVLLLRQRLAERSKAAAGRGSQAARGERPALGMDVVHALAGVDGVDDRQLRRALIQNLLAERFGKQMINDANFQQVVERVTEAIESEADSSRLLTRVVSDLRASAR